MAGASYTDPWDSGSQIIVGNPVGKKNGVKNPVFEINKSVGYTATDLTAAGNNAEQLLSISKTTSTSATKSGDPKSVLITNTGTKPGVVFSIYKVADADDGAVDSDDFTLQTIVYPGESTSPTMRGVICVNTTANIQPLVGNAITNQVPDANMYVDSGADVDNVTASGIVGSSSSTTVYLEDGHSKYFRVGDLIRITNEIMEVTAVGTGADLANSTLTVKRAVHGSSADSGHSNDDAVLIPFFNAHHDFDSLASEGTAMGVQTDSSGRYWAKNFFGYGRGTTEGTTGITPGSIAIKFYESGYQEWGLNGISGGTETGLTASTEYKFNITVDGELYENLAFTTDSNNLRFGGTNGVIRKIQDSLDTQFYGSGTLMGKGVTVGIVGGDLRFTSSSRLSTSAILLADASSGTEPWGVGRIHALTNFNHPIAAKLPDDTLYDRITYATSPNVSVFGYDDGNSNIRGVCNGSINYETGEINFRGPANAHFVVSATYGGLLGGKQDSSTNSLVAIHSASLNSKCSTTLNVQVF